MKFFGDLYERLGYRGGVRLWLSTTSLQSSQQQFAFKGGRTAFQTDRLLRTRDLYADQLTDAALTMVPFAKYFGQACGYIIPDGELSEIIQFAG